MKNINLKLVSAIFYQIFISNQTIALKNYDECFLFYLKSSFSSRYIRIFVFLSSLFFSLSAIALQVDGR